MPYLLTFEERAGYLYAKILAETMTRELALRYLKEIADKCTELGYDRVLIDRDVRAMLSPEDLQFTVLEFLKMIGSTRVAFLNAHLTMEAEASFNAMVGNNPAFKMHATTEEAEKWLLDQSVSK